LPDEEMLAESSGQRPSCQKRTRRTESLEQGRPPRRAGTSPAWFTLEREVECGLAAHVNAAAAEGDPNLPGDG
jgi:hypothetical protein